MKKIFEKILEHQDIEILRNCVAIMAENEEIGMSDKVMLNNLKQLQGEVDGCNYDEETARMHLCLIGKSCCLDVAMGYWHEVKNDRINAWDWCVLWGEMDRQHSVKIRKWFPNARGIDYEEKVRDECIAFLKSGRLPYYDLNV